MIQASNHQNFDDQTIMFDIHELMLGWRDTVTWLSDKMYFAKEDAADRLKLIEPEYLYSFLGYMNVSANDFNQAMRKVNKYSRKTAFRRFRIRIHSSLLSFLLPFI